jgi:AraC-like DNA-binding protein
MIALACCLSIVWTTFTSAPDAYAAVDYAGGEVCGQLAAGAELPIGWGVANRGLLPNHSTVPAATARKGVTARPVLASGRRPRSRVRCGQQPGGGAGMAGTTADRTAGSEYGWSGRIAVTPGQLIYNGMLGPLDPHHHVAIQLAIARSGILSAVDGRGRTATAHALVVPAGQRHVVGGHGEADAVLLYLDPAAPHGRLVNRGIARRTEDPADVTSWVRLGKYLEDGFDPLTPANDLPDRLVEALLTGLGTAHPDPSTPDAVTQRAVEVIQQTIPLPVRCSDVAHIVGLSADRLGRRFRSQIGMSINSYVRWVRLERALLVLFAGGTLTDAAHAAGFADSAHMNRVCHEMFGLAPSEAVRRLDTTEQLA